MFKSLTKNLDQKQVFINGQKNTQTVISEVVSEVVEEIFGPTGRNLRLGIAYNKEQKQITLTTQSKTLASELLLRTGEISSLLRQRRVSFNRLVVR